MKMLYVIFAFFLMSNFLQSYNYDNVSLYNNRANQSTYKNPLNGALEWRYIPGLGYRKFTPYGALRRDYSTIRDTFYYGYYNFGGGSIRF